MLGATNRNLQLSILRLSSVDSLLHALNTFFVDELSMAPLKAEYERFDRVSHLVVSNCPALINMGAQYASETELYLLKGGTVLEN